MIEKEKTREELLAEGFENMPPVKAVRGEERMKLEGKKKAEEARGEAEKAGWEDLFTAKLTYLLEPYLDKEIDDLKEKGVIQKEDVPGYKLLAKMVGKTAALGNIRRDDIGKHLTYFDVETQEGKIDGYKLKRSVTNLMRHIMDMWLTRSVRGFERGMQVTTRTEQQMSQQLGMAGGAEKKPWWKIW